MLLGVDVGGTFTDAVLVDGERIHTAKRPTTADDQSRGVIAAVVDVLDRAAASPSAVESFAHGMTVGTNALLEERGARTALIATRGFGRSAIAQRRSTMACSSGASSRWTTFAPEAARASLSEV